MHLRTSWLVPTASVGRGGSSGWWKMPCRDTGHHFSALGCGQATKIVMRRGGGPELCVDEVSGVENRQVVSPPQDERLVGQVSAPHPAGVCPAELSQGNVQSSRSACPLPPGRGLPRRTNVQPSRSAGCQRASLPGRQLVGRWKPGQFWSRGCEL